MWQEVRAVSKHQRTDLLVTSQTAKTVNAARTCKDCVTTNIYICMYMYIFIYDDDWSAVKGHANEFTHTLLCQHSIKQHVQITVEP